VIDEKLREAESLYKEGNKAQAAKLLAEIVRQDPNNYMAWYGLALSLDEYDKIIYCLKKVLSLNPSHQKARQLLEKLLEPKNSPRNQQVSEIRSTPPVAKKTSSFEYSKVIIIIVILALLNKPSQPTKPYEPYKPNADDAFSSATEFALSKMYARSPITYWCEVDKNKEAAYWYEIQVTDLGNGGYYVIGATRAADKYCTYETSYFAATVRYEITWVLEGEIYFSNPCIWVNDYDAYKTFDSQCTVDWTHNWPDMNWRPPK
jgi:tetratricopeptide (TPR) repeat protein